MYLVLLTAQLLTALSDWNLKGKGLRTDEDYNNLPRYKKGKLWALIVNAPYVVLVLILSYVYGWIYLIGLLGVWNEDHFYYLIKWAHRGWLDWNTWFTLFGKRVFRFRVTYYLTGLICNLIWVVV